jgi:hypothetical protein
VTAGAFHSILTSLLADNLPPMAAPAARRPLQPLGTNTPLAIAVGKLDESASQPPAIANGSAFRASCRAGDGCCVFARKQAVMVGTKPDTTFGCAPFASACAEAGGGGGARAAAYEWPRAFCTPGVRA